MSKPAVTIQYCVPCGFLPRALDVQKEILERFGRKLAGVTLEPVGDGIFAIDLDGKRVYEKPAPYDLDEVLAAIEAQTVA